MHAPALAGQQLARDRIAHERVTEAVRIVSVALEQARAERVVQRLLQRGVLARERGGEQVVLDAAPCERGQLQQTPGGIGESVEPQQHGLAQGRRHGCGIVGRKQLLDVQRVALGALAERAREPGLGLGAANGGHLQHHLGGRERRQLDPQRRRIARQGHQQLAQRARGARVLAAVGDDEQGSRRAQAVREPRDNGRGRGVDPVGVLDHHGDRLAPRRALEHSQDGGNESRPVSGARARLTGTRDEHGELACCLADDLSSVNGREPIEQRAHELRECGVRHRPLAQRRTRAAEHQHVALACEALELSDEPRLAHACRTGEQERRAGPGGEAVELARERRELLLPADENGARESRRHLASMRRGRPAGAHRPGCPSAHARVATVIRYSFSMRQRPSSSCTKLRSQSSPKAASSCSTRPDSATR